MYILSTFLLCHFIYLSIYQTNSTLILNLNIYYYYFYHWLLMNAGGKKACNTLELISDSRFVVADLPGP